MPRGLVKRCLCPLRRAQFSRLCGTGISQGTSRWAKQSSQCLMMCCGHFALSKIVLARRFFLFCFFSLGQKCQHCFRHCQSAKTSQHNRVVIFSHHINIPWAKQLFKLGSWSYLYLFSLWRYLIKSPLWK